MEAFCTSFPLKKHHKSTVIFVVERFLAPEMSYFIYNLLFKKKNIIIIKTQPSKQQQQQQKNPTQQKP